MDILVAAIVLLGLFVRITGQGNVNNKIIINNVCTLFIEAPCTCTYNYKDIITYYIIIYNYIYI